ncbi:hypothetical protein CLV84_0638 [Neolewinella xylanilytica]|uniref:Uncharacterized protein n=1 Tax=Neolewinella xylanilytica TaxID=1514080 RepID=A0A2S6I874_9BACT|nr:hypothetical protein [Neolewinella xylanilytica]PPK87688.1 hypothetical protein CLV84_0638 [Neolewinella xylanilytica]
MEASIKLTLARKDYQLKQILELQQTNHLERVDSDTQGFEVLDWFRGPDGKD